MPPENSRSNSPTPGFVLYEAPGGRSRLSVRLEGKTVWLTQAQMADLFQSTKQNVSLHIQNVLEDGESPSFALSPRRTPNSPPPIPTSIRLDTCRMCMASTFSSRHAIGRG